MIHIENIFQYNIFRYVHNVAHENNEIVCNQYTNHTHRVFFFGYRKKKESRVKTASSITDNLMALNKMMVQSVEQSEDTNKVLGV